MIGFGTLFSINSEDGLMVLAFSFRQKNRCVIGRDKKCDIKLKRNYGKLQVEILMDDNNEYWLLKRDGKSTANVLLNGKELIGNDQSKLKSQDVIQIGSEYKYRFQCSSHSPRLVTANDKKKAVVDNINNNKNVRSPLSPSTLENCPISYNTNRTSIVLFAPEEPPKPQEEILPVTNADIHEALAASARMTTAILRDELADMTSHMFASLPVVRVPPQICGQGATTSNEKEEEHSQQHALVISKLDNLQGLQRMAKEQLDDLEALKHNLTDASFDQYLAVEMQKAQILQKMMKTEAKEVKMLRSKLVLHHVAEENTNEAAEDVATWVEVSVGNVAPRKWLSVQWDEVHSNNNNTNDDANIANSSWKNKLRLTAMCVFGAIAAKFAFKKML